MNPIPSSTARCRRGARGRTGRLPRIVAGVALALALLPPILTRGQSGPVHVRSEILRPKGAPYTVGDSIVVETIWRSIDGPALQVWIDLSGLVTGTSAIDSVDAEALNDTTFVAEAALPADRSDMQPDAEDVVLPVFARDAQGQAAADSSIHVALDTTPPPADEILLETLPAYTRRDTVTVAGIAPEAVQVEIEHEAAGEVVRDTVAVDTTSSAFSSRIGLEIGPNAVSVRSRDAAGNQSEARPDPPFIVTRFDAPGQQPILVDWSVADSTEDGRPRPVRNGDTIRLTTVWAVPDSNALADSLEVVADFSSLDGDSPGRTDVYREEGRLGVYQVIHYMEAEPGRPDAGGLPVGLTAEGPTGITNDTSIRLCLSNHPPTHGSTRLLDAKTTPYRSGDSLKIETNWSSADGLDLRIKVDFSNLVTDTTGVSPRISQQGDSTFLISYRIPLNTDLLQPDGPGKVIPVTCYDSGCGASTDRSLRIDLDTTPPTTEGLTIDPLPKVTTRDSIEVSGTAPEAAYLLVLRDRTVKGVTVPDTTTGRYAVRIGLVLGENKIQVRSEDEAGNSTALFPSSPILVSRVAGATLQIGTPYSRYDRGGDSADDIVLRDPEGLRGAHLRIFNLEGDCLAEIESAEAGLEFRTHWDGTDADGLRVSQGYYLVRAEWRTADGRFRSLTQGLLLKD